MTPLLIGLVALIAWLALTGRLSGARLGGLVALGIGLLAARLALTGAWVGATVLAGVALTLLYQAMDERRAVGGEAAARALLGVGPGADAAAIRAAFRARAAAAHPDTGGSAEAMQALTAARDRLLARARRRAD